MDERFRVFRLEGEAPVYVGTFAGANAKEAVRKGVYADGTGGQAIYEAHVLRNTSVFEVTSRDERFIDSLQQVNSQQHFAASTE